MKSLSLNGDWEIRWSTGQRGGSPYVYYFPDYFECRNELKGLPRDLAGAYEKTGWLPATVPGEVHLDLMKVGIIDNPNYGINYFKARWVEENIWYYRKVFDLPEDFDGKEVYLYFERLDLSSIIYLNGKEIGRHENAFLPLRIKIETPLKTTGNELVVRIDSGLFNVCDKPIKDEYTASGDVGTFLTKRMWLRKPQYEAEWDWSPRLMNVGICGNVSLLFDMNVVVKDWQIRQQVAEDLLSANVTARAFTANSGGKECVLEMTVDGKTYSASAAGEEISVSAKISNPRLWYPVGYGNAELYGIKLRLLCDGREIWSENTYTGFRLVTVDQSPHPEKGHYFVISVNRIPVFFKGGNLVPSSLFPFNVSDEDYEKLTERAIEANFNMLRIWGGGIYESDKLYELCDRKGILLWQEFISACAYPPVEKDPILYQSMLDEAVFQVRRLSRHPSLAVWCGNNELDPAGYDIFMKDYPEIIKKEDPEKYYQPASPYTDKSLPFAENEKTGSYIAGDQHPWEVGFSNKDHRDYRKMDCRFPNEGGILGPTNRKSFSEVKCSDNEHVNAMAYNAHDNAICFSTSVTSADEDLRFWCNKVPNRLSSEEYMIAGGYVQGDGLSEYIDNFRHREFSSASAIFWMFNDCWPCSRSWTIIDNQFRHNMSFYFVKRAFADDSFEIISLKISKK